MTDIFLISPQTHMLCCGTSNEYPRFCGEIREVFHGCPLLSGAMLNKELCLTMFIFSSNIFILVPSRKAKSSLCFSNNDRQTLLYKLKVK